MPNTPVNHHAPSTHGGPGGITRRMEGVETDIEKLISQARIAQKNPTTYNPSTTCHSEEHHSHPQPPNLLSIYTRRLKGRLEIGYCNVERSDVYTHTTLELCKNEDLVFIGEPCIFPHPDSQAGAAQHP